jgi:hypothetical protein
MTGLPHTVTISYLQLLVCDRIREAADEESRQGWTAVDAWINQRIQELQAKTVGIPASSLPVWMLIPD